MTNTAWTATMVSHLAGDFAAAADADRAVAQAAYLRDQFPFFGIPRPQHKKMVSAALRASGHPPEGNVEAVLADFARRCFDQPEREWHYAAVGVLRRRVRLLTPASLPLVEYLVVTHSWWDTVDEIASHLAGGIVQGFPTAAEVMDTWARSEHMWMAQVAILHQLWYRGETNAERLFWVLSGPQR